MRSIKLTAAIAAVVASLVLSCSAASAAIRHTGRHGSLSSGGCRVTLVVAPRLAFAGEAVSAHGVLTCATKGAEDNQPVTLYQRAAPSSTYTVATTGTTEAHGGGYLINLENVMTDSSFYVIAGGAQSPRRLVRVVSVVKLTGPPEGVLFTIQARPHHHPVPAKFEGTVSPAEKGALVVLQRQNALKGNEWHRIGTGVVGEGGTFTIEHNFIVPGPANIRVVVRDPKVNVPGPSNALNYEITQAQNPRLLIESSADPISYGQSVTIHGLAEKLAPGTPLKLLAKNPHVPGFKVVGESKVEAGGKYTFASQTPLLSTFYRVEGGGESSALLYEGVKYLLMASVSPGTTIEEGQSLTFSGTVKPGVEGHVIYLERENPGNTGFHVIEIGTLVAPVPPATEFTYSIKHQFFGVGMQVVRVKIPGDFQNGSTASEPFTIQVNAAPASALTPEPPGNSSLPSEGQV